MEGGGKKETLKPDLLKAKNEGRTEGQRGQWRRGKKLGPPEGQWREGTKEV